MLGHKLAKGYESALLQRSKAFAKGPILRGNLVLQGMFVPHPVACVVARNNPLNRAGRAFALNRAALSRVYRKVITVIRFVIL